MFVISYYPLMWLFAQPLEAGYDMGPIPRESAQALVVLAGGAYPPVSDRPYTSPQRQTYERSRHTAWLYKNWKALPVLASGGGSYAEPLSFAMREVLEAEGVPPDKIWVETRSNSTYENAVYGCEILRRHDISQIVLVDEARLPAARCCVFSQARYEGRSRCLQLQSPVLGGRRLPTVLARARNERRAHTRISRLTLVSSARVYLTDARRWRS